MPWENTIYAVNKKCIYLYVYENRCMYLGKQVHLFGSLGAPILQNRCTRCSVGFL